MSQSKCSSQNLFDFYTVDPCYNKDCGTMKITLYRFLDIYKGKNNYEELGPAKLPGY